MAKTKDENWVRPEHSGFEAPAYGEIVPEGTVFKDAWGNTCVVTDNGTKIIRKA